jgi:hypothetical protein
MIYFGSSKKIKTLEQKTKNDGQNLDSRQASIFHISVNYYANLLKLGIWKERLIKQML